LLDRRSILGGLALGVVAPRASAQPAAPIERLRELARDALLPITSNGGGFAGAGWEVLVREGRASEFFLLGEEHGIAETPRFAAALYGELRGAGFDRVAIETSGPTAAALDRAARGGLAGLRQFAHADPPGPPFYGWQPEAEFLAQVRRLTPGGQVLWGLDYEIWWSDRPLIGRLRQLAPAAATGPLLTLQQASGAAWAKFAATRDLLGLYAINGDPGLVRDVRSAWPRPTAEAALILDTLEETVEINRLFAAGQGYASNQRRASFLRRNLVRHLQADAAAGRRSKVLVKFGTTHTTRGVNAVGGFDIGSLLPEVAATRGGKSFHIMVLGGEGGRHAVVDPKSLGLQTQPTEELQQSGLAALDLPKDGAWLVDLRPLRRLAAQDRLPPQLTRHIHGYDALVVWNGCSPATML
jgi:hypothetical protein